MKYFSRQLNSIIINPFFVLIFLLTLNLSIHIPFLITDYFGEQDAARIANFSIRAAYSGSFRGSSIRSTPLYLDVLRYALKTELIGLTDIPFWMAVASLIASAIITGALFVFVKRLTASCLTALGASLILQVSPIFWLSSLYGFATIVALAFLMISLVLFQSALINRYQRYKYLLFLGACLFYLLAVTTKVDAVVASAIFCLPVWRSVYSFKVKLIWMGGLVLIASFAFSLFNIYGDILSSQTNPVSNWQPFFTRFFIAFENLLKRGHLIIIIKAVGILSIPTAFVSLLLMGWRREWLSTIFWLTMAALPLVLFWSMIQGNSARHNLIPSAFLCIFLALPLATSMRRYWAHILIIMCVVNYLYVQPSSSTVAPSGRLITSSRLLKKKVKNLHAIGKQVAQLSHERVSVIGKGWMHPYFLYELLLDSTYIDYEFRQNWKKFDLHRNNQKQVFLMVYSPIEIFKSIALVDHGYFLVIIDKAMSKELRELSKQEELRDKWLAIQPNPLNRFQFELINWQGMLVKGTNDE